MNVIEKAKIGIGTFRQPVHVLSNGGMVPRSVVHATRVAA